MSRTVLVTLTVLLLSAGSALAQVDLKPRPNAAPSPTVSRPPGHSASGRERVTTRVAVGEKAPNFELPRLDGKPIRLSSLRGGWVMLYFVERRESLTVVDPIAHTLAGIGVRTVAVCYDKSQALTRFLRGRVLEYLPLADPTGDIVALYGLLDGAQGTPRPGFVLIDPHGDVRLALLGQVLPSDDASRLVQYAVQGE